MRHHAHALRAGVLSSVLSLATAACAVQRGHDFSRPDAQTVVLGLTTEPEIVARYGTPSRRTIYTVSTVLPTPTTGSEFRAIPAAGTYSTLNYNFTNRLVFPIIQVDAKSAIFTFWEGKLVRYDFTSDFSSDSTNFNVEKVIPSLEARQATRETLTAALGPPTGRVIYPLIRSPGFEELIYSYVTYGSLHQVRTKALNVILDQNGHIVDWTLHTS
jgi:hypothetical protein